MWFQSTNTGLFAIDRLDPWIGSSGIPNEPLLAFAAILLAGLAALAYVGVLALQCALARPRAVVRTASRTRR
jgi:hypothetical protein